MEQIIVNSSIASAEGLSMAKSLQSVKFQDNFENFVDSLRRTEEKPKGLSPEAIARFRRECADVLNHCNPHDAVHFNETTHLVVGYVQSGKTMSFTGVSALALDNGYRVVIYLAGTKNNLLEQTTKRLRKDLIRLDGRYKNKYKIHSNPTIEDLDVIIGHLESIDKPIILIPILKHYDHINKVAELFRSDEFKELLTHETVLIVDDEADQASLNSFGRKNSRYEDDDKSRTYDSILMLRAVLPGNSYIQYTATPQANILISLQDLLSPKSHTLLSPGEGYVGGKLFFGKGENGSLFNGGLIRQIPQEQVFHKKENPLKSMPQSLKDALMLHILATAIVTEWRKEDGINYLSMMVHPDNTKVWNKQFKDWIDNTLTMWRKALKKPDGHDDKEFILSKFRSLLPIALQYYEEDERPTFEQIKPYISEVLNDKKVYLVNTDKDAETEIEWNDYKMHILAGAEMLNRGFTVEHLATTYMPRYTVGPANADTIQQRCRFFGYKMDYIKSCLVFLPQVSIDNYMSYIEHEEELRCMLASCDNLSAAEHKMMLSTKMKPTRSNVLPIWVVNTRLSGMHELQAFSSESSIISNNSLVEEFLKKHSNDFNVEYKYNTPDRTHRGFKLDIDKAIDFLSDFNFKNYVDARRKADTIRYLRYLADGSSTPIKYVHFIQMAYASKPRERSFDKNALRLSSNTSIFAGPSDDGKVYPGDRRINGGNDAITIQLHHIKLLNKALDFPETAYTLAIYYPDSLAAVYCSNEHGVVDYDDSEEDNL